MSKKLRRGASVECRVYCPDCEQWYEALVERAWWDLRFRLRPQVPVRVCGHCANAHVLATVNGGLWQQWRNWEQAAADVRTATRSPGQ